MFLLAVKFAKNNHYLGWNFLYLSEKPTETNFKFFNTKFRHQ